MEVPSPSGLSVRLDPSELRRQVDVMSDDARLERATLATTEAALVDARRSAAEARECLAVAVATLDGRRLAARKDEARETYREALAVAAGPADRRVAAATWLATVDAINRSTRAALGQVLLWRERCHERDRVVRDAERRASAQRVRAESAEDACARVRSDLAEADRWSPEPWSWPRGLRAGTAASDGATRTASRSRTSSVGHRSPLLLATLLAGEADARHDLARQMADLTGGQASRWSLLLQGFVDALVESAIAHDRLRFDRQHPLWAQLTPGEARIVIARLRDIGFRYDPVDGWYGDRSPQPRDLAVALAYVGIEAVVLRPQPSSDDLRRLPESISVATHDHLLEAAPGLSLDAVHRLVGTHAPGMADLWDHWADLQELLLGDTLAMTPA
ncbi:MAG: hypothetical protein KF809_09310 [Chloroflexi bacterium]|nr:hypothetical protein [Chloroflexota bacterium]